MTEDGNNKDAGAEKAGTEPAALREALLSAALPHAAADGWTANTLKQAAADAGLSALDVARAFPDGADGLLRFHLHVADREMVRAMRALDLENMRIRDRVAAGIRIRLQQAAPHKEAVRRGLSHLGLPHRTPQAMQALYRTVDRIWRTLGDTSTDFNFYTKRGLLAGVYVSTLLFWLNDRSEEHADTWAFLDRRIADIMQIEKAKAGLRKTGAFLPDPLKIMNRLRPRRRF